MGFKVGNITKIIDKKSCCLNAFSIGDEVEIIEIDENDDDLKYKVKKVSDDWTGWAKESDLQPLKVKIGDTVRISKEATIEDFTKNYWNGCKIDTLDFIREYGDSEKQFTVRKVDKDNEYLELYGVDELVNYNIFELVESKAKEMTVSEIEKELGITGLRIKKED